MPRLKRLVQNLLKLNGINYNNTWIDYDNILKGGSLNFEMDIKEAVCAPRFHSQWLPDVIQIEPRGLSEDVLSNIRLKDHKIIYRGGYIGESNGIMITTEGLFGGGDCRGETSAIGY